MHWPRFLRRKRLLHLDLEDVHLYPGCLAKFTALVLAPEEIAGLLAVAVLLCPSCAATIHMLSGTHGDPDLCPRCWSTVKTAWLAEAELGMALHIGTHA